MTTELLKNSELIPAPTVAATPPATINTPPQIPIEGTAENITDKPVYPWMKIGIFLLIALGIAGFFMRNIILGMPVNAAIVGAAELRQSVVASGHIIWPQRVSVASEITGRVSQIPVIEGQQVLQGQLLIQLDNKDELASRTQAETTVTQAEAKVRQQHEITLPTAQQNLQQAQIDADQLQKQLTRLRALQAEHFVSQAEVDTATRDLDIANSKLNSAKLQVETNQAKGSDTLVALANLAEAKANLQLAQVKLEQDSILAVADGTLISRSVEPGDIVQPGKELMALAAKGETEVEVQIDEKNIAKLAVGQQALGSADAFADQRFNAEVMYINPGIDATRGSVEVKLRVNQPPPYLRQDMTVSVDIETAKRHGALVIPMDALRDASSDAPWVMVVRNHHTYHQPVTVGLRGDTNVEILNGIAAGEPVVIGTINSITANQRVRVNVVNE